MIETTDLVHDQPPTNGPGERSVAPEPRTVQSKDHSTQCGVVINGYVNGLETEMLLDTGAAVSMISEMLSTELGYDDTESHSPDSSE